MAVDNLKRYLVMYTDKFGLEWGFHCWAEDDSHAREQCEDAEPGCEVKTVKLSDSQVEHN